MDITVEDYETLTGGGTIVCYTNFGQKIEIVKKSESTKNISDNDILKILQEKTNE